MKAGLSPPSGDVVVTLEVMQVKMGEEGGNVWLGCGKALLWGGHVGVAGACEMNGPKA